MINAMDKHKALNGLYYMLHTSRDITEVQIDALINVRDIMRKAGLIALADNLGRIVVKNRRDGKQVAIGFSI